MTEHLKRMWLPIDDFTETVRRRTVLDGMTFKRAPVQPFRGLVTYEMLKDERVLSAARMFIVQLLKDKKNLGYLYHLDDQRMFVPLNVHANCDLVVECKRSRDIKAAIDNLAAEIACRESTTYEISRLELLYFLIRLVNPHLNWITVDHILLGNKSHAHLMSAKAKLIEEP